VFKSKTLVSETFGVISKAYSDKPCRQFFCAFVLVFFFSWPLPSVNANHTPQGGALRLEYTYLSSRILGSVNWCWWRAGGRLIRFVGWFDPLSPSLSVSLSLSLSLSLCLSLSPPLSFSRLVLCVLLALVLFVLLLLLLLLLLLGVLLLAEAYELSLVLHGACVMADGDDGGGAWDDEGLRGDLSGPNWGGGAVDGPGAVAEVPAVAVDPCAHWGGELSPTLPICRAESETERETDRKRERVDYLLFYSNNSMLTACLCGGSDPEPNLALETFTALSCPNFSFIPILILQ